MALYYALIISNHSDINGLFCALSISTVLLNVSDPLDCSTEGVRNSSAVFIEMVWCVAFLYQTSNVSIIEAYVYPDIVMCLKKPFLFSSLFIK